ncbi:hypothetical protein [Blastococcus sp. URHD0036]|uniref:hypothetical protein n=1 Tax=Blastococcus sp. URHD0036 TaxID=1380356 RepID=UPI0004984C40|nr:hypothetical protein [Blastococcus sp. URHD0036]
MPGPPAERPSAAVPAADDPAADGSGAAVFADLDQRPVSEHVDVYEAEHARLERELRTIDQL